MKVEKPMRHAEARTLRVFAINPRNLAGHTDRGSHRGARQIHNRLTRFSSHLISYFYHRAPLRCGATRACHQRPAQGGLALAPAAATTAAVSFPTLFLIFIIELSYAAAPLAHTISDPLISDLVRETVPARLPRRTPVRGGARSTEA